MIVIMIKVIHSMSKTKKFNMSTIIKVKETMLKEKTNNNGGHKGTKVIETTKTTKAIGVVVILIKEIGTTKEIKAIGVTTIKATGEMMEKNADSEAQIASHNTSIGNLEVQLGQISQALNTRPKGGALSSDTVVNSKGGNNMGHGMAMTIRSGKGGDATTSNQRRIVDENVIVQEDEIPSNVVQANEEVRIDIDENVEETQEEVNQSREHVIDIPEPVVPKAKAPMPRPPPTYPQRLTKQNSENQFKKFIDMMKSLSINVPLVEELEQMSRHAKFMKDLVTKKRSMNCETIKMTHQVSAIVHSLSPKLEDPSAFTIPYTIGSADFAKALCDLGESINLIPYSAFKTLGIGQPRPTSMRLQMADRTMKRTLGIIDDVLVRVDKFILLVDFVILDCEVDYEEPIVLGRPFLTTGKGLVDVEADELTFRVGDKKVVFHMCKLMRQPNSNEVCSFVDLVADVIFDDASATMNVVDKLDAVLLNLDDDEESDGYVECVNALQGIGSYTYEPRKLSLDLENLKTPPTRPSIEEPSTLELKPLPPHPRMPFGLCNALTTFQRCMMAIFTGMVEDILEVFMDDFSMVGNLFDDCLKNLDRVLARCVETNLVLNWEKCHFMVEEGIVLGHKISKHGIEVDQAKIEVISKLPPPTSVKGKYAKFHFNEDCMKAFELLKFKLTTTHIVTAPDWSLPFELMCYASDVAIGAVLEPRINKIFHPVYYASKTMNDAQVNYIVIEKDLLAIVFAMEKF
ncbi:uncharacterized protein [Nicotiana sylvestris]|uniref:uncharacterized protein n=1 Tax=Nicotiana sylvestris TaxID=4096 RepID=UPI00388C68DE